MKRLPVALATISLLTMSAYAYTVTRETAVTADGVTLVMKRYKSSGPPVILCHGIVQNFACMDLAVSGSSLARYLADRGYDVWVGNLRSHGRGSFKSGSNGQWDWSIDEFAIYDIPAMVNKVRAACGGRKPFYIGHSMGGMALNGYLEGVYFKSVKVDEVWGWGTCGGWPCWKKLRDVYGRRVVRDATLGSARNNLLRGVVTVATPVRLKWLKDVSIWNYWLYNYWDYNLIVNQIARSDAAHDALVAMSYLPAGTLTAALTDDLRNLPYVGGMLASFLQWVFGHVGSSYLAAQFWYPPNMNPTIAARVIDDTLDNTASGVFLQFLDSIRHKTFRERHADDPMRSPYVYADHYGAITAPYLMITGGRDKMTNDNITYTYGFKKLGSADKGWRDFYLFGHDDLVLGRNAKNWVYPAIYQWLLSR